VDRETGGSSALNTGGLRGKVAVVTGGSGAIGSAILGALSGAGARAISLDIGASNDPAAEWIACDVRNDDSVAAAIALARERHGHIDIVVHAAGISHNAVIWKTSPEDWDAVQQVNLRGAFLLLRHSVALLRENEGGGRVVLIGSINGSRGKFGTAAYSASKAGLIGLAKTAARETGKFAINVNVVEPGWVRTPLTEKIAENVRQQALAETLTGQFVEPADVAATVLFLCGEAGRRITGQVLRVDSGQLV
jgi:NAD(P)-dependent dehydrogenase (short-subunit alcohol dehydrogenase family)